MIADIHCHISTKPMFVKNQNKNCYEKLEFHIFGCLDELIGGDIVDSQSCLSQQFDGGLSFSINPIYGLEQNIGSLKNIQLLITNRQVDDQVIRDLATETTIYHDHFKKEYQLIQAERFGRQQKKLNFITPQNKKLEVDKLNVLTSIEGIHSLFASRKEYEGVFNNSFFNHLANELQRIFPAYLTLTHMYQTGLFSISNGVKMSSDEEAQWFMPYDRGFEGLNKNCRRVLNICHENKTSVDLKHTSFANRLAIYEYIEDHDLLPPIATHNGLAYMTFSDYLINNKINIRYKKIWPHPNKSSIDTNTWPGTVEIEITRNKGPLGFRGNCAQINLFDEDIIAIMTLGGLIGISFDQRILGATALKNATTTQVDQISPEDGNFILSHYNRIINKLDIGVPELDVNQLNFHSTAPVSRLFRDLVEIVRNTDRHLKYFIQSILYLLKVGYNHNIIKPWRFICLGSDYDGLINSINCCVTSDKLPEFRDLVINDFIKNENKYGYNVLQKVKNDGIGIIQLVNQIFFFNAVGHFIDVMELDGEEFINGTVR